MHPIRRAYRSLVKTEERWFRCDTSGSSADILRVFAAPIRLTALQCKALDTLVIDLCKSDEALWEQVDKDTRYDIRRAERDGVQVRSDVETGTDWLTLFKADYEQLRRRKSLDVLRTWQIEELVARGALSASTSHDASGAILTWHVYVVSAERARLLHSVTRLNDAADAGMRAMIGRANRHHHWRDILRFRDEGKREYDLGGIYRGTEDNAKKTISDFKSQFGGRPVTVYDATIALTWRGRLGLMAAERVRSLGAAFRKARAPADTRAELRP